MSPTRKPQIARYCQGTLKGNGNRTYRCQLAAGHEGKCSYHRQGSQGGTVYRWWGVNPDPNPQLPIESSPHCYHCDGTGHLPWECPEAKEIPQVWATEDDQTTTPKEDHS